MGKRKEYRLSGGAEYLTTLVSVSLLLLIIGSVALLGIAARRESQRLQAGVELSAVMADSVTDAQAAALARQLAAQPYVDSVYVVSKAEALDNWSELTGENLEEVFGVNPLSPEVAFTLHSEYTSPEQVEHIVTSLTALPQVEGVARPDEAMILAMTDNIAKLIWVLGGVALVMIVISVVLINNTVHLSIYARRFIIHTMQLVGATDGFVLRPVAVRNGVVGMIAGGLASVVLAAFLWGSDSLVAVSMANIVPWGDAAIVFAALIAGGAAVCAVASAVSATIYLRKDYDKLFS